MSVNHFSLFANKTFKHDISVSKIFPKIYVKKIFIKLHIVKYVDVLLFACIKYFMNFTSKIYMMFLFELQNITNYVK